jgi:hypothetical protein
LDFSGKKIIVDIGGEYRLFSFFNLLQERATKLFIEGNKEHAEFVRYCAVEDLELNIKVYNNMFTLRGL